jgi:ABC-type dipeptide/oligopeptide/nickel transport system permease component
MARYLAARVGLGVLTILGVVLLTFVLMFVVPGDPARSIAGPRATPEVLALVRANLHLNQPVASQLAHYLTGMLRGDLGVSYVQDQSVSSIIGGRLPATLELGLAGLALELVLGAAGSWRWSTSASSRCRSSRSPSCCCCSSGTRWDGSPSTAAPAGTASSCRH